MPALIVHALSAGSPVCGFMAGQPPSAWPANHKWVPIADTPAFAPSDATSCELCKQVVWHGRGCPLLLDDPDDDVVLQPASKWTEAEEMERAAAFARLDAAIPEPDERPLAVSPPLSLVAFERCELCETPLVMKYPDGKAIRFTAHTPEFCRLSTLARIKLITDMWRRDKLEHEAWRRSLDDVFRRHDVLNRRPPVEMVERWIERLRDKAKELKGMSDDRDPVYPLLVRALTDFAAEMEADLKRYL